MSQECKRQEPTQRLPLISFKQVLLVQLDVIAGDISQRP